MDYSAVIPSNDFGSTGLTVSRLGLGTYCLVSERGVSHQEAEGIMAKADELGISLIDTAPLYGCGEAEQIVGEYVDPSSRTVIFDKIGRFEASIVRRRADEAYRSHELIKAQVSHSLRTLRRESLDCMFIHEADDEAWGGELVSGSAPVLEVLQELKDKGVVKSIGISLRDPSLAAELAATNLYDAVLFVHYANIVWQESKTVAVEAASASGMGIAIGAPFRRGVLLDGSKIRIEQLLRDRPKGFTSGAIERLRRLQKLANTSGLTLGELGLRYLLSDTRIHSVLVGVETPAQLTENARWAANGPLPREIMEAIIAVREVELGE